MKTHKSGSQDGEIPSTRNITISKVEIDSAPENDTVVFFPFEFSTTYPPSIITEGSHNGPWRKKITEMDGTEDEKDLPQWVFDCIMHNRCPLRENPKCPFYLQPYEGSTIPNVTPGKLSAPPVFRIQMVINYLVEKLVLDKQLDNLSSDETLSPGLSGQGDESSRSGLKPWQKLKSSIEILCNNQVLKPDMTLATVRVYIWKKSEDLVLHHRSMPGR